MNYKKAAAGEENISGVHINKLGAYSHSKLTDKSSQLGKPSNPEKKCYQCDMRVTAGHIK